MNFKPSCLLLIALVLRFSKAQDWKAPTDCKAAVPMPSATWGRTAAVDLTTAIFLDTGGVPVAVICPGVTYNLNVKFPEPRRYIVATTQGNLSAPTAECLNRVVSLVASTVVSQKLTLPCTATGYNYIRVASVNASAGGASNYKYLQLPYMISPLDVCVTSPCATAGVTMRSIVDSLATAQAFPGDAVRGVQQTFANGLESLGENILTNLVQPLNLGDELRAFTTVLQGIRNSVNGSGAVVAPSEFLTGTQQMVDFLDRDTGSGVPGILDALATIGSTVTGSSSSPSPTGLLTALQTVGQLFAPEPATATVTVQSLIQSGHNVLNSLIALVPQGDEPPLTFSDLPALITLVRAVGTLFNELGVFNQLGGLA